jgi:hypothetical protein
MQCFEAYLASGLSGIPFMDSFVFGVSTHIKIIHRVVQLVVIDVMNNLIPPQFAA